MIINENVSLFIKLSRENYLTGHHEPLYTYMSTLGALEVA